MGETIRILIADDHPVVRYGLTHMLNAEPELSVVGEAADAHEVVEKLQTLKPDVIILDMEMGEAHGVDALRALRAVAPEAGVVIYTAFDDAERIVEAVQLGVQGYLLKDAGDQELARAIRVVHAGGTLLQPAVATKLLRRMRQEPIRDTPLPEPLTERERQVVTLLAEGHSNQVIADTLHISERTVKFHVSAILAKLTARNRTEAVLTAVRHGIVKLVAASG
ncbi:MAG: response regulator transcription factor [Gammaproteobacteria bacterium]|jgi:DNA-binding NarL/FixJ family response regulator|nr:response regulator transcription factor [Gammaproteobacteria bacterium]